MAATTLRGRAIALLARRDYARSEIERRLLARGGARAEIRALLDGLAAEGLLSDARYARAVVARSAGSVSRRRIVETLKAAGVSHDDIDAALAETDIDDEAALAALWRRRFGRAPADERDKARQVRFLQSRGFGLASILKLLREQGVDHDRSG
ncbi:MAG TPA: regulatory protein RecX [Casimicrobiaceae bacterium]|nr:regulatory protein RecX [Casimicrobiaceae bacterium]